MTAYELSEPVRQGMADLGEEIDEHTIKGVSQKVRAVWLQQEEQRAQEPKLLGQEVLFIDAVAPLITAVRTSISEDPELSHRFFDESGPRSWQEKAAQVAVECLMVIERGEELSGAGVKTIVERAISQESPNPEVVDFIEQLKTEWGG